MDLIKDNKLIAVFMGAEIDGDNIYAIKEFPTGKEGWKYDVTTYLKFNESWDWLMPVVDKIADTCRVEMEKDGEDSICTFEYETHGYIGDTGQWNIGLSLIESTYKAVLEYIKWFNDQNDGGLNQNQILGQSTII